MIKWISHFLLHSLENGKALVLLTQEEERITDLCLMKTRTPEPMLPIAGVPEKSLPLLLEGCSRVVKKRNVLNCREPFVGLSLDPQKGGIGDLLKTIVS